MEIDGTTRNLEYKFEKENSFEYLRKWRRNRRKNRNKSADSYQFPDQIKSFDEKQ